MPHILKNKNLEVHIDLPAENYIGSRFDHSGKIVKVKFYDKVITGIEEETDRKTNLLGKGLYNEFGIDLPIGFHDIDYGDHFHKIGVGLLKKDDDQYNFNKDFEMTPCNFETLLNVQKINFLSTSPVHNDYAYLFKKEIELFENSFIIRYYLKNTGKKEIVSNEYNHNFITINNDPVGQNYILTFPFLLKKELFDEIDNPENTVILNKNTFKFNRPSEKQFFFKNITGGEIVKANWELINTKHNIKVSETASFNTNKINLWGWNHVISPELFFNFNIKAGQEVEWFRKYTFTNLQ